MPIKEQTQKVVKSFTTFWEAQDKKRKIAYIGIIVCIILAAVIITIALNKKDYIVLYEGLETTEASFASACWSTPVLPPASGL